MICTNILTVPNFDMRVPMALISFNLLVLFSSFTFLIAQSGIQYFHRTNQLQTSVRHVEISTFN